MNFAENLPFVESVFSAKTLSYLFFHYGVCLQDDKANNYSNALK
jgi:hypothetical protein